MESSGSDSEEENFEVEFWNNWKPPPVSELCEINTSSSQVRKASDKSSPSLRKSFIFTPDEYKFGNWIPPNSLIDPSLRMSQRTVQKKNTAPSEGAKEIKSESSIVVKSGNENLSQIGRELAGNVNLWRKELNPSWGERVQLHDVTKFNDGDLVWGIVNLGMFADIRLWVNEYGIICGLAEGKISKLGSSEVTFISIKSTQLLRKMLNLSPAQWASLCEAVEETKTILKFNAFEVSDLTSKTSLEKLWYFICKRRHFLPNQSMLVKLCGAVRCLRQFKITTKLVVQEIRNLQREPIL